MSEDILRQKLVNFPIPSDAWKKNRDRIARRVRRHLHLQEKNPGPQFYLRFDYVMTAAQVTRMVEEVMVETERLVGFYNRPKVTK